MNGHESKTTVCNVDIGHRGETLACDYLEQNGFVILRRNYRAAHQEIDIIAHDTCTLIFAEVKTRRCTEKQLSSSFKYGRPAQAVNAVKRQNLTLAARAYLREYPTFGYRMRFDVIEVYIRHGTDGTHPLDLLKIHHIRNAFFAAD